MNDSPAQPTPQKTTADWPASLKLNDLDQHIWDEELDPFVPSRVFDMHTHVYRWEFNTDPHKDSGLHLLVQYSLRTILGLVQIKVTLFNQQAPRFSNGIYMGLRHAYVVHDYQSIDSNFRSYSNEKVSI